LAKEMEKSKKTKDNNTDRPKPKKKVVKKVTAVDELTNEEREAVTVVFHQYETGLREGTIFTKDVLSAFKALGLNPAEQETIDMTNEVGSNGLVYFPDFCKIVLRKYREEDRETLNQTLFKAICGTESYPSNFRAKKYKIKDKYFSKADFQFMMSNLPVPVKEEDIDQMFEFADKDKDGKISYSEFQIMINPQVIVTPPKHSLRNLRKFLPQLKVMAKKEGITNENEEKQETKLPLTAETVISVFKDEKVYLKL